MKFFEARYSECFNYAIKGLDNKNTNNATAKCPNNDLGNATIVGKGNAMSTANRVRKQPALPSKRWHTADVIRLAYLAGEGKSAGEIARIIGATTPERVRAAARFHGIQLLRGVGNEDILQVRWKREDRQKLDATADKMDRNPGELAALVLRKALGDRSAEKMVDRFDVVGL